MDWAIVVTGAVGLAGIGGTLLSARMTSKSDAENLRTSVAAEDARAELAEKRRVYANCLAALIVLSNPTENAALPLAQQAELLEETFRAQLPAASEITLIGSTEVVTLANRAIVLLRTGTDSRHIGVDVRDAPGPGRGRAADRIDAGRSRPPSH